MSDARSNVALRANVMLLVDPETGLERTQRQQAEFSPGDLAATQNRAWNPIIRDGLTSKQLIEYEIYLPCIVCGRIAGVCSCRAK